MRPARAVTNLGGMAQTPKRPRDANQLAKFIVDMATEGVSPVPSPDHEAQREGGKIGGKTRARTLSATERSAIASKGAEARWQKVPPVPSKKEHS